MKITDNPKIKTSTLMKNLEKKFKVYSYWDSKELNENFPAPKKQTVREFKEEQESTDEKGKSWNEIKDKESMMTLREYILFFEAYFDKTGKYPDEIGWTVFRDSLPGGRVAGGDWNPNPHFREVRFGWGKADSSGPSMGARLEIYPQSLTLDNKTNSVYTLDGEDIIIKGIKYTLVKK